MLRCFRHRERHQTAALLWIHDPYVLLSMGASHDSRSIALGTMQRREHLHSSVLDMYGWSLCRVQDYDTFTHYQISDLRLHVRAQDLVDLRATSAFVKLVWAPAALRAELNVMCRALSMLPRQPHLNQTLWVAILVCLS